MTSVKRKAALVALACACFTPAWATEGGLGRPITGTNVTSFAGVVPPEPGFSVALGYAHYSGSFEAERELPINSLVAVGMDATFDLVSLTGVYVWDTGEGRWNFASMATLPVAKVDASATVTFGPRTGSINDREGWGLFDPFFAPVIAGYHIDKTRHVSLALYVYSDWGHYESGRLANLSLNNWTFSPTVGYTQLMQGGTLEFSASGAVDFYTENEATDYRNGAVFRVDALLVKRFANGWGVGGAGGWIEQLEDDEGALADRLDGFRGRSLALGPIVTYSRKLEGGGQVELSARWLSEFDVKRRVEGNPLMVTAVVAF